MIRHYKIKVKGRVQGVWFRKHTKQAAVSHDLNGFVKNQSDGCVYVEVEGPESKVQDFIKWLEKGSPLSEVKEVNISEGEYTGFSTFEISR